MEAPTSPRSGTRPGEVRFGSPDGSGGVVLTLTEDATDSPFPSSCFYVTVESDGFRASRAAVWLGRTALDCFGADARRVEAVRTGSARLEALSPGEFALELTVVDRAGHLALTCILARTKVVSRKAFTDTITLSFAVDPMDLLNGVGALTTSRAGALDDS